MGKKHHLKKCELSRVIWKGNDLVLASSKCLKEFKSVWFIWRSFPLSSAGERWDAGSCKWPSTFLILKNRCWSARNICTKKKRTCIYVMYIYKDITNTQWDIKFFFFSLCAYVCKNDWLVDWCLCMHWLLSKMIGVLQFAVALIIMKWLILIFTSEIQNHCPKTGQCSPLMYINEMCTMVVFWSWLIGLNVSVKISNLWWRKPQSCL